jgi:integrase/recombinase XerD
MFLAKRGRVYNRIFDEQEWKEVNKENKYIMDDFLEEYRQRKMKESTLSQYKNDLRIVMIYIKRKLNNRTITDLTKKDFRRFSLWLTDDLKLSNARVNRIMSAVRSLLTYVEDDDDYDYDNNVAKKVKGLPKEAVRVNEDDFFLSHEQVMKLRNELIKRDRLQDAVLLMLMYDSGARRNEVYQVVKHGLLDGNKTNIVTGKRGKQFPLIYLDDTKELIRQYLEQRGEDDIDSLWIVGKGENKRPASYNSLYERIVSMSKVLSELEGKEINFFPHSLRHSRCEVLLQGEDDRIIDPETGKPKKFTLEQVQVFLHHSDPKTTQGYAKDHTEEIIDSMFNFG